MSRSKMKSGSVVWQELRIDRQPVRVSAVAAKRTEILEGEDGTRTVRCTMALTLEMACTAAWTAQLHEGDLVEAAVGAWLDQIAAVERARAAGRQAPSSRRWKSKVSAETLKGGTVSFRLSSTDSATGRVRLEAEVRGAKVAGTPTIAIDGDSATLAVKLTVEGLDQADAGRLCVCAGRPMEVTLGAEIQVLANEMETDRAEETTEARTEPRPANGAAGTSDPFAELEAALAEAEGPPLPEPDRGRRRPVRLEARSVDDPALDDLVEAAGRSHRAARQAAADARARAERPRAAAETSD